MGFIYFISSDKMGSNDPELGQKLMRSFVVNLLASPQKPSHIIFVEKGVKLLTSEFPVVDAFGILEKEYGVELLACVTCLDYYGIRDALKAGKISNMPDIIEAMHESDKVIHI